MKSQKLFILLGSPVPTAETPYVKAFVHTRLVEYRALGYECRAFYIAPKYYAEKIDGIWYESISESHLLEIIKRQSPSAVLVHFVNKSIYTFLSQHSFDIPVVLWVHGWGMISWRRSFSFERNLSIDYALSIYLKVRGLYYYRQLLKRDFKWVYVSQWMKKMADEDSHRKAKDFAIIPNPIDDKLFKFSIKSEQQKFRILIARSFDGMKYAPDTIAKIVKTFLKDERFNITIAGAGRYYHKYVNQFSGCKNVAIFKEGLLSRELFAQMCSCHGYFLCPTRMDTQGVAMCEAAMAGCIPITNPYPSVYEFCGFNMIDCTDIDLLPTKLLSENFNDISASVYTKIYNACHKDKIIHREIEYIG